MQNAQNTKIPKYQNTLNVQSTEQVKGIGTPQCDAVMRDNIADPFARPFDSLCHGC